MKTTSIILLAIAASQVAFAQGKLDRAKEDLSNSSSSEANVSSSYSTNDAPLVESVGILDGFFIQIFYSITFGTLFGEVQPRTFYPYPYAEGKHGEYNKNDTWNAVKKSQFMISNTVSVHPDIIGNDLRLNYRFLPFLGIEANHLHFFQAIGERSDLGISSLLVNFYRIREKNVTGYWGIGLTYAGNEVSTAGFAYNLGLDIYVGTPVSLGFCWKQSFINESSIKEGRILVKYHLQQFDIHGGFIYHQLGDERAPSSAIGLTYRF